MTDPNPIELPYSNLPPGVDQSDLDGPDEEREDVCEQDDFDVENDC